MRAATRLIPHVLAAAALLVLSACSLDESGLCTTCSPNLDPGPQPQTTAIVCDIEAMGTAPDGSARVCFDTANQFQQQFAVPTTHAALALNTGQTAHFSLSKVPDALNCGTNGEVRTLIGMYPQGTIQCVNPNQIGSGDPSADVNAACVKLCEDLVTDTPSNPPSSDVQTFCQTHARASTNVMALAPTGFANACSNEGAPLASFFNADPRVNPENVDWSQLTASMSAVGNTLTRNGTGTGVFDQSAVSTQWVQSGDAYVEFSAQETNVAHLIGFSSLPTSCTFPCFDSDPGTHDVTFGINLGADGHYYVVQSGVPVMTGPDINGSFGTYSPGDRFRITLFDAGGGLVNVQYSVIVGTCTAGGPCNQQKFYEADGVSAAYPFRVDTSFQLGPATLTNVTLMRIMSQ